MRIVTARRMSQVFFVLLFLWFCVAATVGPEWWRLRGWPINWILSLDPLAALSVMLTTGSLYSPLLWALATLTLTAFIGRFFCGFICPLGAINQFLGWIGLKGRKPAVRALANRPRAARSFKYFLLAFLLACAAMGSLQVGVFDPLPLLHRSVNLTLAPLLDSGPNVLSPGIRHYDSALFIGLILIGILAVNLFTPRFFCRFVCPLGAMFGILGRFSPWRVGKGRESCGDCSLCESHCEGACHPSGRIVSSECVLCMNCLDRCPRGRIHFGSSGSVAGESPVPDLSRRGLVTAALTGLVAAPLFRLGGLSGPVASASLIRPPGALEEERFLARCIRCGQCMRVCPTNVVQPTLWEAGIEGIWSPSLDYRIGGSGCQLNCVACGHVCPTAAIRPLSIEEKLGEGRYAEAGPIRVGAAFVDRTRCLPWSAGRPCIVCQEVCPVSPKAIYTDLVFEIVRNGRVKIARADKDSVELPANAALLPAGMAAGDYYVRVPGQGDDGLRRVIGMNGLKILLAQSPGWGRLPTRGETLEVLVKLQRPCVDLSRCIGCGVCEHECPITHMRGIRVTSDNESRSRRGRTFV